MSAFSHPRRCLFVTAVALLLALTASSLCVVALHIALLATFICVVDQSFRTLRLAAYLSLPFAPLLFLVHGVINPVYPIDTALFDSIGVRAMGIQYAALVSARLILVTLGLVVWRRVDQTQFAKATLSNTWIPAGVALTILQVTALIHLFSGKAASIISAQRSRGVPIDSYIWQRVMHFPAVVVPLIAIVLTETDQRHSALKNRGVGVTQPVIDYQVSNFTALEITVAIGLVAALFAAEFVRP